MVDALDLAIAESGKVAAVFNGGRDGVDDAEGEVGLVALREVLIDAREAGIGIDVIGDVAIDGRRPRGGIVGIEGWSLHDGVDRLKERSGERVGKRLSELRGGDGDVRWRGRTLAEAFIGDGVKGAVGEELASCPYAELILLEGGFEANRVEEVARVQSGVTEKLPGGKVELVRS